MYCYNVRLNCLFNQVWTMCAFLFQCLDIQCEEFVTERCILMPKWLAAAHIWLAFARNTTDTRLLWQFVCVAQHAGSVACLPSISLILTPDHSTWILVILLVVLC